MKSVTRAGWVVVLPALLSVACGSSDGDHGSTDGSVGGSSGGKSAAGAGGSVSGGASSGGASNAGASNGGSAGAPSGGSAGASAGSGGTSSGGDGGGPAHVVGACDDLADVGVWENVTPAALSSDKWCVPGGACDGDEQGTYGTNAFVLDPNNSGTVYLGTASLGVWKTTDCGGSWVQTNTGTEAEAVGAGRNWSMQIDPNDSQTLYTVTGYAGAGFYKTTNGGTDWEQMFPSDMLANFPGQGIEKLSMDPTNSLHLTASFHNPCANKPGGGGDWACMAETTDGGDTFTLTNSAEFWNEGNGQTMVDDKTWFFSNGGGVVYLTTNGGESWDQVYNGFPDGNYNSSGCVYTAKDGTYYTGGSRGMLHSTNGTDWEILPGGPHIGGPNGGCSIVDDGTNLYASMGLVAYDPASPDWFWTSTNTNPTTWTTMNNPAVITGAGWIDYDADHHLIYTSNSTGGFLRVVVE